MTWGTRVFANTFATYSRSFISAAVSIFTARWVLLALGSEDFGLYGVVGGLIVFVSIVTTTLTSDISRFYALEIGAGTNGERNSRLLELVSSSVVLHIVLAMGLFAVGYPLGIWLIQNVLVIPPDRIEACIWVFRFAIITTLVSFCNLPFVALYTAHQFIAVLVAFDVVRIFATLIGAYYLLVARCDRLVLYAGIMAAIAVVIQLAQFLCALKHFAEARHVRVSMARLSILRDILHFSMWHFFGVFGWLTRMHGGSFLINLYHGPKANAAFGVAMQFATHATTLANSLTTALTPAITSIVGAGQDIRANQYTYRFCKASSLLVLVFIVPLVVEVRYILSLWLKIVPEHADALCVYMSLALWCESFTSGMVTMLLAHGKVSHWQSTECVILSATVPVLWIFYWLGGSFVTVGMIYLFSVLALDMCRVAFSRRVWQMDCKFWFHTVLMPVIVVSGVSFLVGFALRYVLPTGFLRLTIVAAVTFVVICCLSYIVVFDCEEKRLLLRGWKTLGRRVVCRHRP